jgi:hypothetical protein
MCSSSSSFSLTLLSSPFSLLLSRAMRTNSFLLVRGNYLFVISKAVCFLLRVCLLFSTSHLCLHKAFSEYRASNERERRFSVNASSGRRKKDMARELDHRDDFNELPPVRSPSLCLPLSLLSLFTSLMA